LQLTQFTWSGSKFTITDTLTVGAVIEIGYWDDTTFVNSIAPDGVIESGNLEAVSGAILNENLKYKADLEVISNNLFNKATTIDGFYIEANTLVAAASTFVSDYIPVVSGQQYIVTETKFTSYFDASLNYVSGGTINSYITTFTPPTGAKYIRCTWYLTAKNTAQLNKGNILLNYDNYQINIPDSELSKVYDNIRKEKLITYENDWYDPNFLNDYTFAREIDGTDYLLNDFAFLAIINQNINKAVVFDGYNSQMIQSRTTGLVRMYPSFSINYLTSLGYEVGDYMKVGFWLKVPDATGVQTRRLYKGGTVESLPITIKISNWQWFETETDFIVTSDNFQTFNIGMRDMIEGERYYIRGLTLTNITKDIWIGERISTVIEKAQKEDILNLNPYAKKIFDNDYTLVNSYEQINTPFTSSIISVTTPIKADGYQFVGTDLTEFKLNLVPSLYTDDASFIPNTMLFQQIYKDLYFRVGFWVKASGTIPDFSVMFVNDNTNGKNSYFLELPKDVWIFVKSQPFFLEADTFKDLTDYNIQLNATPTSGAVTYQVTGLTWVLDNNPLGFRCEIENTFASESRFYNKIYTSYGDSITAFNDYQGVLNKWIGSYHRLRGIGGSKVSGNTAIAWVDADGLYIDRPPSPPPAGTEGVDYFEITTGMSTQQRVDTIPLDTELLTILAGANDGYGTTPLGSWDDTPAETTSFYSAYKLMLDRIIARVPNANIFILNLIYHQDEYVSASNGTTFYYEFREAIRFIGKMYGLPVIEVNDVGVNNINWVNYSSDEVHPNPLFSKLIGEKIAKEIKVYSGYDSTKGI